MTLTDIIGSTTRAKLILKAAKTISDDPWVLWGDLVVAMTLHTSEMTGLNADRAREAAANVARAIESKIQEAKAQAEAEVKARKAKREEDDA